MKKVVMPWRTLTGYDNFNGSQWSDKSPTNALAKTLIWLKENGHMEDN